MKNQTSNVFRSPVVENWYIVNDSLIGYLYNHPTQDDGAVIRTSGIVSKQGNSVVTEHSRYLLGRPAKTENEFAKKVTQKAKSILKLHKRKNNIFQ